MARYQFERQQIIPAALDEVFGFFSDAANLQAITPPSLGFQILTPQPIEMARGSLIDYRLSLYGVPFRWRTRITEYEPRVRFVDEQERGPYAFWHHLHEFETRASGTFMRDLVTYEPPLGPIGRLANSLFIKKNLHDIFDYRRQVIETRFGNDGPAHPQAES